MASWIVGAVLATSLFAQNSPDDRVRDFDFTVNTILTRHPQPFRIITREDFEAEASMLRTATPQLSPTDFYTRLATLVAKLGDGHSRVTLTNQKAVDLGFKVLPIQLGWYDDGLFAIATSSDFAEARGAELVRVNNMPIGEVVDRLIPTIAADNRYWIRYLLPFHLRIHQVLEAVGVLPPGASPELTFRRRDGTEVTLTMPGLTSFNLFGAINSDGLLSLRNRRPAENYWSEYLPDAKTVYVRYRLCTEQTARPFSQFVAEAATLINNNPVDSIIIDLRGNTGGNSAFFNQFTNMLAQATPALLRNSRFQNSVFLDAGTFSAGIDAAMDMKNPRLGNRTTYVGSPVGGRPDFNGDVVSFTLPASGLDLSISSKTTAGRAWIPRLDSVYPDTPLSLLSTDYFTRHDVYLAHTFGRSSSESRQASKGIRLVNAASLREDQSLAPGTLATVLDDFPEGALLQIANQTFTSRTFVFPPLEPGVHRVAISVEDRLLKEGTVQVTATSPGVFVATPADPSQLGLIVSGGEGISNTAESPAHSGEIIRILTTGVDPTLSDQPTIYLGMTAVKPEAIEPDVDKPGAWWISVRVPQGLSGQNPLFVMQSAAISNPVTFWVR